MNENMSAGTFDAEIAKALAAVNIGYWLWHPDSGDFSCTTQYEQIMGYEDHELPCSYATRAELIHPDDRQAVEQQLARLLTGQAVSGEHEFRLLRKNGSTVWVQERFALAEYDEAGKARAISGFVYDISRIKQAELQAVAAHKRREVVARLADLGSWEWDVTNDHVTFDNNYKSVLGRSPQELNGSFADLMKLIPKEDAERLTKGYQDYFTCRDDSVFSMEIRAYNASGHEVWLLNIATVMERDEAGKPTLLCGGVLNIDKTVRMRQKLRRAMNLIKKRNIRLRAGIESAQHTLAAMFEANPQINILVNDQLQAIDCNPAAVEFFEFANQAELLAQFQIQSKEDVPDREKNLFTTFFGKALDATIANGHSKFLVEIPDKSPIHATMKRIPYGGSFAVIIYLSERSEIEERIQVMLDVTPLSTTMFDEQLNVIDCNLEALKFIGVTDKQDYIQRYIEFFPELQPDGKNSLKEARQLIKETVRTGRVVFNWTYVLENGETAPTEVTLVHVPWHNKSWRLISFVRDLREMIAEQDKTRDAEVYTQMMLDSMPMICAVWGVDGKIIDCNMEALRLMGLQEKSDYLNRFYELNPVFQSNGTPSRQMADEIISKALETGYQRVEWEFRTASGQALPSEVILIRVAWNKGYRLLAYSRDLREIKKANAAIERHTSLLHSVNELANKLIAATPDSFHEMVIGQLKELGKGIGADRVYIWENYRQGKHMFCRQSYAWEEEISVEQPSRRPCETLKYNDVPYLKRKITSGEIINSLSKDLPDEMKMLLDKNMVKAILIIPIRVESGIWGFIRFDECLDEILWSTIDQQTLQSCGILIASSILRNRMTGDLIAAKNNLLMQSSILKGLNNALGLLLTSKEQNFARKLHECIKTLGTSVGADRVSLWRNAESENGTLCSHQISGWITGQSFLERGAGQSIDYPTFMPEWDKGAAERKELNLPVRYLHETLRNYKILVESVSLLLVHIDIDGEFWGFIGYAHDHQERLFSPAETEILRSGGIMIASAIMRREAGQKLMESFDANLIKARAEEASCVRITHQIDRQIKILAALVAMAQQARQADIARDCLDLVRGSSEKLLRGLERLPEHFSSPGLHALQVEAREFDLARMLAPLTSVLQERMAEKKQHFHLDVASVFERNIIGDEKLMALALTNLLENAIKYTPEGGHIRLYVWGKVLTDTSMKLVMEVIDDGIGIEPQVLTLLLRLFAPGSTHTICLPDRSDPDLSITQNIVAALQGSIAVESVEGKGSRFVLQVPVLLGQPASLVVNTLPAMIWPKRTILLAGATADEQALMQHLCHTLAMKCDLATEVEQARQMMAHAQEAGTFYDLLVLDQDILDQGMLAKTDGTNGADEIWLEDVQNWQSRILLLTDEGQEMASKTTAEQLDIQHVLTRPLLPSAIYNKLLEMTGQMLLEIGTEVP